MDSQMNFAASIWKLGDNVNTDLLHPPDYFSLNEAQIKAGVHEGMHRLQATFSARNPADALVIIVSEETGGISLAIDGALEQGLKPNELRRRLELELGVHREEEEEYGDEDNP